MYQEIWDQATLPPIVKVLSETFWIPCTRPICWRNEVPSFGGQFFWISIFGDGAMIKSVPLINVLAAGPNNPFALLDIVDCTSHVEVGGKKDAPYIANMILP